MWRSVRGFAARSQHAAVQEEGSDMASQFTNNTPVPISPGAPSTVTSRITVSGLGSAVVEDVDVTVDIDHSWTGDLQLSLLNPSGQRVVLSDRRGGRRDDFRDTRFDSDASIPISSGTPPFRGTFRPEGNLADFRGRPADGDWTLEVRDRAFQDGGTLRRWGLAITTAALPQPTFRLEVRFMGGLSVTQQDAFDAAARRWSEIITGDLPSIRVNNEVVDDVVIEASGVPIDGPRGTLGQAGPTALRPDSFLPAWGIMQFDTADLAQMEADGSLVRVIIHEMGHVLGFGTIWDRLGLRQGTGTINPTFTGANAMREFGALQGLTVPVAVPVANTGGPGTRDAHWREAVFGNELLTGFLNTGINPISRMSIGAFEDLGYQVDYAAADAYVLPSPLVLASLGVGAEEADHGGHGIILVPPQTILPEDAYVDR
jgi:subtilisin-like proprotein convertase family protein